MMDSKGKTKRIDSSQYSLFSLFCAYLCLYILHKRDIPIHHEPGYLHELLLSKSYLITSLLRLFHSEVRLLPGRLL